MKIKWMLLSVLIGVMVMFTFTACKDESTVDATDSPDRRALQFWEITDEMSSEEAYKLESRNYKIIKSLEPLYEEESYKVYKDAISNMELNKDMASVNEAIEARNNLVQTSTVEDRVWFLWGDTIPVVDGEFFTEEELDLSKEDAYGSEPIIIKYLLEDPSKAKGNIILVSGGGFQLRGNKSEGYPAAEVFNDLGYNCFLLQRRVEPYSEMDIFMDFQRAVRMVKFYAEEEGYGGKDMIAGAGWSGGGGTILGAINNCYGNLTPVDIGASNYVSDEIDELNSDLDVAMIIYGAMTGDISSSNANIPAFYICAGTADAMVDPQGSRDLYDNVKDKVPALLNMIEGAPHSFGVGTLGVGGESVSAEAVKWPAQADIFMQENLGHSMN